jgi:hypothetical protein
MLTMTELAARLKQAMRTVERWHRKGVVLGIKVDGVVMFYWPAVVARLVEKYQERDREEGGSQMSEPPAGQRTNGTNATNGTGTIPHASALLARMPPVTQPAALTRPSGARTHPMGEGLRSPSAAATGAARSAAATTKRPK